MNSEPRPPGLPEKPAGPDKPVLAGQNQHNGPVAPKLPRGPFDPSERFRQAQARRAYNPGLSARAAREHGRGRHGS
jgi:hypothetical protein